MITKRLWILVFSHCSFLPFTFCLAQQVADETGTGFVSLHPENQHDFRWRGEPTILLTSGMRYGGVLKSYFDCVRYVDELSRHGLNGITSKLTLDLRAGDDTSQWVNTLPDDIVRSEPVYHTGGDHGLGSAAV